jgi:hypothetical protein
MKQKTGTRSRILPVFFIICVLLVTGSLPSAEASDTKATFTVQ